MKKFEYKITKKNVLEEGIDYYNEMGIDGWELSTLVKIEHVQGCRYVFIWKRELEKETIYPK